MVLLAGDGGEEGQGDGGAGPFLHERRGKEMVGSYWWSLLSWEDDGGSLQD